MWKDRDFFNRPNFPLKFLFNNDSTGLQLFYLWYLLSKLKDGEMLAQLAFGRIHNYATNTPISGLVNRYFLQNITA